MIRDWVRFRGNAPAMFTDIARRNGDVAYFRIGPAGFYLLSSPELVHDVLVDSESSFERISGERRVSGRLLHEALFASEGETHARQRGLMEPVMYRQAPSAHAEAVVRFAARMADGWTDGQVVDVLDEAERMTCDLMVHVLFGLDPSEPEGRRMAQVLAEANAALNQVALGATPLGDKLPSPSRQRFRRKLAELEAMVDDLGRRRIAEGLGTDDVLSMLLRAGDRAMAPAQARDEAIGLYRGQAGVGAVLSWTWFLLSQNPEVRDQVEREADRLGRDAASVEEVHAFRTAAGAFRESIRLYPTAWLLARKAVADHKVNGTTIPAGSSVLVSPWILQRDPRSWDDPEAFRPDRYADPFASSDRQAPAYLPQGLGSKRCMAMELLPVEVTLVIGTVARRVRLDLPEGHVVELLPKVTLKPKGGLPMVVRNRSGTPASDQAGPEDGADTADGATT